MAGCQDGSIRVRDSGSGRPVTTLAGHAAPVLHVTFAPVPGLLASSDHSGQVRVWDTSTGRSTLVLPGSQGGPPLGFSPDGRILAAGSIHDDVSGTITLWDSRTGAVIASDIQVGDGISALSYCPTGRYVAVGDDVQVQLWDTGRRQVANRWAMQDVVNSLSFDPSGKKLAAGVGDGTVQLLTVGP